LWGFDPQDALTRALDARGYKRVLLTPQGPNGARWSMEEQRWLLHGSAAESEH
jgi:hypothetical protein